ncbi:MAG: hypothetical protein ACRD3T_09850 [Terriglobia bacterium]
MPDFNIVVVGAPGSVEDWAQALHTPVADLPELTGQEKEDACRRGVSEEDCARRLLLERLADGRWRERGARLAEIVRAVLKPLQSGYPLQAVIAEASKPRWTVRFEGGNKPYYDVHLDSELVDDLLNFNAIEDMEKLRVKVLSGIGRNEYVVR